MQDNKLKQISKAIIVSIVVAILIIICIIGMIKTFWGSEIETVFILANKVSINIEIIVKKKQQLMKRRKH